MVRSTVGQKPGNHQSKPPTMHPSGEFLQEKKQNGDPPGVGRISCFSLARPQLPPLGPCLAPPSRCAQTSAARAHCTGRLWLQRPRGQSKVVMFPGLDPGNGFVRAGVARRNYASLLLNRHRGGGGYERAHPFTGYMTESSREPTAPANSHLKMAWLAAALQMPWLAGPTLFHAPFEYQT